MKSTSSISSSLLKNDRCGTVASPTPTVPISSDSMSRMLRRPPKTFASAEAVIHPAVPPPTMVTDRIGLAPLSADADMVAKTERRGGIAAVPPFFLHYGQAVTTLRRHRA